MKYVLAVLLVLLGYGIPTYLRNARWYRWYKEGEISHHNYTMQFKYFPEETIITLIIVVPIAILIVFF